MNESKLWEFECSVECDAERTFAWAFWADVSNWERLEGKAVEWIKLDGPFAAGTQGVTKSPGQEARSWVISEFDDQRSATIKMAIDSALFLSRMTFESLPGGRTKISQRMSLEGEAPQSMLEGIKTFETTAPQGLAKLGSAIEAEKGQA